MIFSIITVCFNNPLELMKTLTSIKAQSIDDYEVIVINGGERLLVENIVSGFGEMVSSFVSEPDEGVYDAMNKGAAISQGDYVIYLNSGDTFSDIDVLNNVKHKISYNQKEKILYGSSISDYGYKQVLCKAKSSKEFLDENFYELGFSHQSIFVAKNVLGSTPFDLNFKVAADFDFLYPKLREYNDELLYLDFPISIFATGGISDIDKTILNKEKKNIYFMNNPYNLAAALHFNKLIFLEKIKKILRPIIRRGRF